MLKAFSTLESRVMGGSEHYSAGPAVAFIRL